MSAPRVCASNDERLSVDELKPTRRNGSYDTLLDTEKPSAIVLPKRNTDRWSHSTYCVANGELGKFGLLSMNDAGAEALVSITPCTE